MNNGIFTLPPALMGNILVWKPSSTAVLSGYYMMKSLKEAGLPDGVINFIPGKGSIIGEVVLNHRELAGIHFTGSHPGVQNPVEKGQAKYRSL